MENFRSCKARYEGSVYMRWYEGSGYMRWYEGMRYEVIGFGVWGLGYASIGCMYVVYRVWGMPAI